MFWTSTLESLSLPMYCSWLDQPSATSQSSYWYSLPFALHILPCRFLTQLDQQMRLGILLIPSPAFDNYRVWLAWASMLVMKVLVIFRPSSNQLWVGSARKSTCIWTSWVLNMWNTRLIINYSARWFDFGKCFAVALHENQTFYVGDTEPESDHVYYQ